MEKIIKEEQNEIKYKEINLYGSDIVSQNVKLAKESIEKLNLTKYIKLETKDFVNIIPSEEYKQTTNKNKQTRIISMSH